jgi:molecular chaperone GrpE
MGPHPQIHGVRPMAKHDEQQNLQAQPGEADAENVGPAVDDTDVQSTKGAPASLEEQLEALRAEKEEQFRSWQRTQADFVNFRRRVEQERGELIRSAEAGLLHDLLPILDDLERAIASLPPDLHGLTWVDGVLLIERKLAAILEHHGLKPIEALGTEFDPNEHEAVLREGEPGEATTVIAELQRGYRLNDRVLRPTLVKVGPASSNSNEK